MKKDEKRGFSNLASPIHVLVEYCLTNRFSSALNFREPRFFCFLMKQRHFTGSQLSAEFFSRQHKAVPETLRWLFQFLGILFANLLAGLGTVFSP